MVEHKHCTYLREFFQGSALPLKDRVEECRQNIEEGIESGKITCPDYLACTGVSGLIVAAPLSIALDIPLIVVRKQASHSSVMAEGIPEGIEFTYLIVDDFVWSGGTVRNIKRQITRENENAHFVGCYVYIDRWFIFSL